MEKVKGSICQKSTLTGFSYIICVSSTILQNFLKKWGVLYVGICYSDTGCSI
jgi:hypothetical protein